MLEYIELEKIFYQYMKKTKRKDTCFSPSRFSDSSSSRLTDVNSLEYENLDAGKISSFDFHQYIVSHQFILLQNLSMHELSLMRASSFISDVHKYLTSQVNFDSPMIVDAWIFNAALNASNTCNFYVSCYKSDNSHNESYLKVAGMFLEARNELRRFGISRGLLDKSATDVFSMIKKALSIIENDLDANDDDNNAEGDNNNNGSDEPASKSEDAPSSSSSSTSSAQPPAKEPLSTEEPFTIEKRGTDCNVYTGEPDTEYITKAIKEYMATAHHQNTSSSSLHAPVIPVQQDKGQSQQPVQPVQPLSASKRMTFTFKGRTPHPPEANKNELQKSASPTVPNSGGSSSGNSEDSLPKSVRRTATTSGLSVSLPVGQSPSAQGSLSSPTSSSTPKSSSSPSLSMRLYKNTEADEMLAIEHFYASLPQPMLPKEKDDLSRFSDSPVLLDALKSEEAFDPVFIGLSEKAQKAFNMANRPRASLNLFCEVALHYL